MTTMRFTSASDLPGDGKAQPGANAVDPSPFVGTWLNTNDESHQRIARVILTVRDGALIVHAFGDCAPDLCDLGEVTADVFADSVNAHTAMSFSAVYEFGFMETYLQSNVKHGTLVIASCNKFKDGSGRSNYYTREFFYRSEDDESLSEAKAER